jgi:hypothetical protein
MSDLASLAKHRLACQRLKHLLDLAAQARREGRGDDVVRYLQEALAAAEALVHGILDGDAVGV